MKSGHTVIMLGAPLSGKTTLCQWLTSQFNFSSFEFGSFLRDIAAERSRSQYSDLARAVLRKGILLDDKTAEEIFLHHVRLKADEDFVTDGFPRTKGAVLGFLRFMRSSGRDLNKVLVVHLAVEKERAINLASRRSREDDLDAAALAARMLTYEHSTPPTISELSRNFPILELHSDDSIEENVGKIARELQKLCKP